MTIGRDAGRNETAPRIGDSVTGIRPALARPASIAPAPVGSTTPTFIPPPPLGRATSVPPAPFSPPAAPTTTAVGVLAPRSAPPPVPADASARSSSKAPPPLPPRPSVAPSAATRSSQPLPPPPPREDLREQLAKITAELRDTRIELEQQREQVKGRDQHIADLRAQLTERDAALTALREQRAGESHKPVGDDLKRIRGIGPSFERTLQAAGITTFAAIAVLTEEDIPRIAALLNTQPARIVRADWVGQAKALLA